MDFRINTTTHRERYEITKEIQDVLAACSGYVLDSHLYSNISTVLNIEISAISVDGLIAGLEGLELNVKWELSRHTNARELRGTLQITFVHNDPDIRHEVPMVPG